MKNVYTQLRRKFDGADSFVSGGHSVRGAGHTLHSERIARTPEWVNDDVQVRSLLLKVFPKLGEDENQFKRAAQWTLIIHLYFRMGMTSSQVAVETGSTDATVRTKIRNIKRAAANLSTFTGKPRSVRGRGRPKKNNATIGATM